MGAATAEQLWALTREKQLSNRPRDQMLQGLQVLLSDAKLTKVCAISHTRVHAWQGVNMLVVRKGEGMHWVPWERQGPAGSGGRVQLGCSTVCWAVEARARLWWAWQTGANQDPMDSLKIAVKNRPDLLRSCDVL